MLRGVDVEGLVELAIATERITHSTGRNAPVAVDLLRRHGRSAEADALQAVGNAVGRWATELGPNLRWRAEAVRAGENARFDIGSLLRARFAMEAPFCGDDAATAFGRWIVRMRHSDQRVATVVAEVSSWLSQSLTDWDVTNADLHNITDALADLTGPELDQVLGRLSPAQLQRWLAEMGHSVNGFSRDEKRDVFAMLAANASGQTLGRFHDTILTVGGLEEATDFGIAIAAGAAEVAIVEFVDVAVSHGLAEQRYSAIAPALAVTGLDAEESIDRVADVIAKTGGTLTLLLVDSVLPSSEQPSGNSAALLATLARTTDSMTRSTLFAETTEMCTNRAALTDLINERQAMQPGPHDTTTVDAGLLADLEHELLTAATRLMLVDPNGTIQDLATNLDRDGAITTTYWGLLVGDEQGATIADILARLRGGDVVRIEEFSRPGPDPTYTYPHARNLAYTAATLNLALTDHAEHAKGDIDRIAGLANVITTAAGALSGVGELGSAAIGLSADWGVTAAASASKDGIDGSLVELIDTVTDRLRPPEGVRPISSGAASAWTDVYLDLMPFA